MQEYQETPAATPKTTLRGGRLTKPDGGPVISLIAQLQREASATRSPPSCGSSVSGASEQASVAERLFDLAVQKQEARQKKTEVCHPLAKPTVMGGQQVCNQACRPCNDGGVTVTAQ